MNKITDDRLNRVPTKGRWKGKSRLDRFWEKIDRRSDDECWLWLGAKTNATGHGSLGIDGQTTSPEEIVLLSDGVDIPSGFCVFHECKNSLCMNPNHFSLGTQHGRKKNQPHKIKRDVRERFWSWVDIRGENECWEWKGSTDSNGYGRIAINKKHFGAHRVSWEFTHGVIPLGGGYHGMCVLHHCDNPKCVNPRHLFLGTQKDNMDDMHSKGRWKYE